MTYPAPHIRPANDAFLHKLFSAKAANNGGVVRRSKRDVHREVGLDRLHAEVTRRGFHLLECGDQYIVVCNRGHVRILA